MTNYLPINDLQVSMILVMMSQLRDVALLKILSTTIVVPLVIILGICPSAMIVYQENVYAIGI